MTDKMMLLYSLLKKNNISLSIAVYPWPSTIYYEEANNRNYIIWKKFCKKNNSIEIIKRNLNQNNIPWVFPAYVRDTQVRERLFKFGWQNGYSITSWPSLPKNLINKRNKKIWNKLVCFNTDQAPSKKSINLNNYN